MNNPSAFPWQVTVEGGSYNPIRDHVTPIGQEDVEIQPGLTIRQYYAAMAMQGLLVRGTISIEGIPEVAFKIADAMIERG